MKVSQALLSMLIGLVLLEQQALFGAVISERILFLKEDGEHYLSYVTNRSQFSSYNLWYEKDKYPDLETALKNVLYFFPNEYTWDTTADKKFNILHIQQGSYAILQEDHFKRGQDIKPTGDGGWIYTSWDGKTRTPEGHFGLWNSPVDFAQFVYVWVVPEKFEVVSYRCNRPGKWVKRKNTIAYYGKNVNDLVFTITYRPKNRSAYRKLAQLAKAQKDVGVDQVKEGVKLTVGATVLFAPGSSDLSPSGKAVLQRVAASLKNQPRSRIIVSGFTDNSPIQGKLKAKYATNWELSAARALAVVHYFASQGIDESRLEARAYGAQRPIASNNTPEGRARNRRIEIIIAQPESS